MLTTATFPISKTCSVHITETTNPTLPSAFSSTYSSPGGNLFQVKIEKLDSHTNNKKEQLPSERRNAAVVCNGSSSVTLSEEDWFWLKHYVQPIDMVIGHAKHRSQLNGRLVDKNL